MHYVSTRGRAPQHDFSGVLLAGLAEDGGLFMPEQWPDLLGGRVARAARPALSGAGGARDGAVYAGAIDLETLPRPVPRGLCRRSGIRRRCRWCNSTGALAAGAVPRPDAGVQGRGAAAARAAVRALSCARATSISPSSARPRATPGRRRSRPVATARASTSSCSTRSAASQRGAAPADDDGAAPQRPQHRDRGRSSTTARTLVKAHVRRSRLLAAIAALGGQLDQLGAAGGADRLLFRRRARARRAGPRGRVRGADRQFRRRVRGLGRATDGAADRAADRRDQPSTTSSTAALSAGDYRRARRRRRRLSPVDGHPGQLELRAAAVRAAGPRRRRLLPDHDRRSAREGAWRCRMRPGAPRPACSRGWRSTTAQTEAEIRRLHDEAGYLADPHTAIGIAAARAGRPGTRRWRWRPPIRPSFRTLSGERPAFALPCRRDWPTSDVRHGTLPCGRTATMREERAGSKTLPRAFLSNATCLRHSTSLPGPATGTA